MRDKIEIGFVLASVFGFIALKFIGLDFRMGDGNAYVYMAQSAWHGVLPYTDYFLADPPGFIFLLAPLAPLLSYKLLLVQTLPVLLEAGTAYIVFLLLKKWGAHSYAALAPFAYLASFSIIATSDFFTGVQLVMFLVMLGLLQFEQKRLKWAGICWALACLVKLYAVPAIAGFVLYALWQKKPIKKTLIAYALTILAFMAPFLLLAPHATIDNIILHQFRRPAGLSKLHVLQVFWQMEMIIIVLGMGGLFITKHKKLLLPFALSLIFLAALRDLYYLYLNIIMPFLIFGTVLLVQEIGAYAQKERGVLFAFLLGAYLFVGIHSVQSYYATYRPDGVFSNAPEIGDYVATLPKGATLYGSHELVPLLALASGKRIFDNHIDTNTQVFAAQSEDLEAISNAAAEHGVYLIARIADYPQYGITDQGYEGYFSETVFKESCESIKKFNSASIGVNNMIGVYWCKK